MKDNDCVFCKMAKGEIEIEKIKDSNNFFAIRDAKPRTPGHSLVIPKKHFVTLLDVPNKLGLELLKLIKDVASDLIDEKKGDGFNVINNNLEVAGQVVMHAHVHVIPRKVGDGYILGC
jgi:histidine triad (HIT) family protein